MTYWKHIAILLPVCLVCCISLYGEGYDESRVTLLPERADTVAFETLIGISSYGWDPVNKGILINWRRDNPDRVNNSSSGDYDDRNTETRHDSQNDIRTLQHYYWFKRLHEGADFFDVAIERLEPTVRNKFEKISSKKGWMYYVLLRLWKYGGDKSFWKNVIMQWGNNVYNEIDPELGVFYETNMANCDCGTSTIYLDKAYRVDHQVEAGAAMVDAGTRFNRPEWVEAGYRQVQTAYEQAFVEDYGLFGRIYLLGNSGYKKNAEGQISQTYDYAAFQNRLWDGQCKLGEASEEIDALIRAAAVVKDPDIKARFIEIAEKMLDALEREAIHDKVNGGFFQMMYVADSGDGKKSGYLSDEKKEMRQASLLGTYSLANRIIGNRWQRMEDEMLRLLTTENTAPSGNRGMYLPDTQLFSRMVNGYRGSVAGYSYQLKSDWSIYSSKSIDENWVSNESNSLALLGLFQYMTPVDDISETDNTEELSGSVLINEDFTTWAKQGALKDATIYSQHVQYPYFSGEFKYRCSAVDPGANTNCAKKGRISINPSEKNDSGWLMLPELPSVGLIKINREGKTGANMRLDRLKAGVEPSDPNISDNANWEKLDADTEESVSGCVEYVFSFTSQEPVRLRITTTGNSSNNLAGLYVERYMSASDIPVRDKVFDKVGRCGNTIVLAEDVSFVEIFSSTGVKIHATKERVVPIDRLLSGMYIVRYFLKSGETGAMKFLK